MNPNSIGLRIISVLLLTGVSLVGTPDLGIAANNDDDVDTKQFGQVSLHQVDLTQLTQEDVAYIEGMQDHLH